MKKKRKTNKYCSNDELVAEIMKYKTSGNYSEELGKMLLNIATNIAKRGQFSGYTYIEDMKSESILTCLKYMHNFNPEKNNNAFGYITMIIFNSFKLSIKKEGKHSLIKDKMFHLIQEEIMAEIMEGN